MRQRRARLQGLVVILGLLGFTSPVRPLQSERPEDRTVIKLPGRVDASTEGGGGRFLIFALPQARQIAVFDTTLARVAKYLPMADDAVQMTSGKDYLFVFLQNQKLLQRWNLNTLEREATVLLDIGDITSMAMGSAANGPLAIAAGDNVTFYQPATLEKFAFSKANITFRANLNGARRTPDTRIAASSDGMTIAGSHDVFIDMGGALINHPHSTIEPPLLSADGSLFFSKNKIYAAGNSGEPVLQLTPEQSSPYTLFLPTSNPAYFAGLRNFRRNEKPPSDTVCSTTNLQLRARLCGKFSVASLDVFSTIDLQPLFTVFGLDELEPLPEGIAPSPLRKEIPNLIFLVPDAGLLVTIGTARDELVLRRVDFATEIERNDPGHLLVTSLPTRRFTKGESYRYTMKTLSRNGGLTYKLEAGPPGMDVDARGVVTWLAPASAKSSYGVLVSIEDSARRQIYHAFTIEAQ